MRCTVLSLLLTALAVAQDDIKHPRSPDQPLPITYTPWFCTACIKAKMISDKPRSVELMGMSAQKLLEKLKLKRGWIVIESPNFMVLSTLKGLRIRNTDARYAVADLARLRKIFPSYSSGPQGGYVDSHQRAHLYHIRLEREHAHFAALTGNKQKYLGMGSRFQVYLFEKEVHYRALVEGVLGHAPRKQNLCIREHVKGKNNYSVMTTSAAFFKKGDRLVNNIVAHQTGHMLANGHRNFYRDVWAFLEVGCAHYYERRESVQHNHFCLEGTDQPAEFVRGNWRKRIRHMVYRKKDPTLGRWCETIHPQQLSGDEHAVAWAIFDWLATTDPVRLAKLFDRSADSKKKMSAADAIEDVFGVSPYVLHDRWRAYVLKTYK